MKKITDKQKYLLFGLFMLSVGMFFNFMLIKIVPITQQYGDYNLFTGDITIHTKHPITDTGSVTYMNVDAIERTFNHELVHYKIDKGLIVIDEDICAQYRKEMPYLPDDFSCNEVYAYQLE
jgi:hypothetical protein